MFARAARMAVAAVVAGAAVFPSSLPAQETRDTAARATGGTGTPTFEAARRAAPVEIDGDLSDPAWRDAPVASGFVQGEPTEGAPPVQPTEVRILYDEEALYVGARLHEEDPGRIADQLVRRDERGQYDWFEISLDPNLDRQTGYTFRVGASGVERDAYVTEGSRHPDVDWNAVWESAVRQDSAGWTVEMRIPLSQIRFESRPGPQTWGVNFTRRRVASSSMSYFSLESRTVQGTVSQWGRLTGIQLRRVPARFEVEPYVVGQMASRTVDPGNPLASSTEFTPRVGGNLSYGIGSAFTLDATVNPDFGQVEVDPAVINLTAFETFFPEKRPFFVQDAQIFDFEMSGRENTLFFSRRIGREPQGGVPGEPVYDSGPDRTTILGATKFTGRTRGGLSVGALAAVTGEETATGYFPDSAGGTREFVTEPRTGYGVLRLKQDFRDGATSLGGILTGVERGLPAGSLLDWLPERAFSAGLDLTHQWGGPRSRRYALEGFFAATHVRGSPEAMLEIQTNPQHYFQRPDARDLSVDSTATHMTGANWRLELQRQEAEHWTWAVWVAEITSGFAANDIGFSGDGARLDGGARVGYRHITPGDLFRSWRVNAFTYHNARHTLLDDPFSGDAWARSYEAGTFSLQGDFEFLNNWGLNLETSYSPQAMSDTETRGGPLMTSPAELSFEVRGNTDRRKVVGLEPSVEYATRNLDAGRSWQMGLEVAWRPAPSWELSLEPRFRDEIDAAQYVETVEGTGYASTFGSRYLFGRLHRKQISMETRLSVAFSPDLSLQLFAQPLISAGDYTAFRQLERPESFAFETFEPGSPSRVGGEVRCVGGRTCVLDGERYVDFEGDGSPDASFGDPDFNVRSLRGNAVLRWEYLPGSILFLVWQHDRRGEEGVGSFAPGRDLGELFDTPAENRFIVKLSHYLEL